MLQRERQKRYLALSYHPWAYQRAEVESNAVAADLALQGVWTAKPSHVERCPFQCVLFADTLENASERLSNVAHPGQLTVRVARGLEELDKKQDSPVRKRIEVLQKRRLTVDQPQELPERKRREHATSL